MRREDENDERLGTSPGVPRAIAAIAIAYAGTGCDSRAGDSGRDPLSRILLDPQLEPLQSVAKNFYEIDGIRAVWSGPLFYTFRFSDHRDSAEHAGPQRLLQAVLPSKGLADSPRLLSDVADSGGIQGHEQGIPVDELVVLFESFDAIRHNDVLRGAVVPCR